MVFMALVHEFGEYAVLFIELILFMENVVLGHSY